MPPLTVSPWFETRRGQDYDRLLAVRTDGDWDAFGLSCAAYDTWNVMVTDGDQRSCLQIAEAIEARSARASRDLAELWRRLSSRR